MDDKTLVERVIAWLDGGCSSWNVPSSDIRQMATRIDALEAALRFYARENNWKSCGVYMSGKSQSSAAEIDRGQRARQALEGSGND